MKNIFTLLVLFCCSLAAWGQSAKVTGKITDTDGQALLGANVMVKGTPNGAVSDLDGAYEMMIGAGRYTFIASYTGYTPSENTIEVEEGTTVTLNFNLTPGNDLDVVVVSSSKKPEKLTESPATIETIFAREIEEYAGNPGELLARQKGIDYFRAGIATPAFNIRGFNSNFNSKNLQVTDGRFSTLVATGLPFGPLATVIKEDIERVEVILGPNATLYGPNAHNGLMNTITKDPRTSAGTTIAINPGVNGDGKSYFSGRFRHAQ